MDKAFSPIRTIGYLVAGGVALAMTTLMVIGAAFPELQGGILRFAMLLVGCLGALAAATLAAVAATTAIRGQLSN